MANPFIQLPPAAVCSAAHHPHLRLVGQGGTVAAGGRPRVAVAIPVRNEVARIEGCLRALDGQLDADQDRVMLLLNGCIDGTQAAIAAVAPRLSIKVHCVERDLRGADATAGMARSLAVKAAAAGLTDSDVIMTTDADGAVAPDWVAANLRAIGQGADIVCGRAVIDWAEALLIPEHLHEDDARECRLAALIDEIATLVDPEAHDPWPRHTEHSGASLAFRVAAWRRAGGVPPIPCGEDRAFVERLIRLDARVRHDPAVQVTVSGRTVGRAAGGMADTIRRRILAQDEFIDAAIESAADRYRRVCLRAEARQIWSGLAVNRQPLIEALNVAPAIVEQALAQPSFGEAWRALERDCPVLFGRRVRFVDLPHEIAAAEALRAYVHGLHDRQAEPFMASA